jgi:hypothetical protein
VDHAPAALCAEYEELGPWASAGGAAQRPQRARLASGTAFRGFDFAAEPEPEPEPEPEAGPEARADECPALK